MKYYTQKTTESKKLVDKVKEYIEANKQSWGTLAEDHYQTFKARLLANETLLNSTQIEELGDNTAVALVANERGSQSNGLQVLVDGGGNEVKTYPGCVTGG